jgi:hypothetical protein
MKQRVRKTPEQSAAARLKPNIGPTPAQQRQYEIETYRSGRKHAGRTS